MITIQTMRHYLRLLNRLQRKLWWLRVRITDLSASNEQLLVWIEWDRSG